MGRVRRRLVITLVAALTLALSGVAAATPQVFTVAGVESLGAAAPALCDGSWLCRDPSQWPAQWTATARRFAGECLDHFADGSLLLCSGGRLFRVTPDGRAAALDVRGVTLGIGASALYVTSVSIGADGAIVVIGDRGAARIAPDGSARMLVVDDVNSPYSEGVQVLPDGSALIAEGLNERVTRVWPDGHRQTVAGASRGGHEVTVRGVPALAASLPAPTDVAVLPDDSFVIADNAAPEPRVMRVDTAGVIRTVAGGGHGWREGAPGTSVALGATWAVATTPGGDVLIGSGRGVLELDTTGRIHTVVRGTRSWFRTGFDDARQADTDGRAASDVLLSAVADVDLLPDGSLTVLTGVPNLGWRVALVGSAGGFDRVAVALPADNRTLVHHGRLDILLSRAADVHVVVRRSGGQALADLRRSLPAGNSVLSVPAVLGPTTVQVRVDASTTDGRVASALRSYAGTQLTVAGARALTTSVAAQFSDGFNWFTTRDCRQAGASSVGCRWSYEGEDVGNRRGRLSFHLRADGLIRCSIRRVIGSHDRLMLLEPR